MMSAYHWGKTKNKKDLYSFNKRLYWHCHFVQKLHTEPELEFFSMHRMCDSLRTKNDKRSIIYSRKNEKNTF